MTDWPATLPQDTLGPGYSEEPVENTIRSSMSYGPDKVRRRATAEIFKYQIPLVLTTAQTSTLDTFYYTTLECTGTFDWKNHRTGASATYRFLSAPVYGPLGGGRWATTLALEILP